MGIYIFTCLVIDDLKGAVSAGLECVRTLTQARKSVYIYACSKQTVNYNFRPGIGQKEVFARSAVAFSRHLYRVVLVRLNAHNPPYVEIIMNL